MIKNIVNWTAGSMFRTIGRVIAYLIIGIIVTLLLTKFGVIGNVNATTGSITSYNWRARYYTFPEPGSGDYGQGTWCSFISGSTKCSAGDDNIGYVSGFAFRGYYSGGYKAGNSYTFKYTMNVNDKTEILNNLSDINSNISNRQVALANGEYSGFTFYDDINVSVRFENSSTSNQLYVYISFISDVDFKTFAVAFDFNNGLYFGSVDWIQVTSVSVTYSEGVGAQIDNQTNIMNENQQTIINNINNTNESINQLQNDFINTEITTDLDTTNNFFRQFDLEGSSNFTQLILLPINFLSSLQLGYTDDLCFTLKGQRSCLPNGKILWQKNSSSCPDYQLGCATSSNLSAFITFFDLVVGGFLSYKLILKIIRLWHDTLDPTKNGMEVMKL